MATDLPHQRETRTLQFARFIVRNRFPVSLVLIAVSIFFFIPIVGLVLTAAGVNLHPQFPIVRVDTNARDLFPDHPYIHAQDKFSKVFGSGSLVALAVVVERRQRSSRRRPSRRSARSPSELDGIGFDSQTEARDELRDMLEEENYAAEERRRGAAATPSSRSATRLDRAYPTLPGQPRPDRLRRALAAPG